MARRRLMEIRWVELTREIAQRKQWIVLAAMQARFEAIVRLQNGGMP
jgi:hypothetical protein